MIFLYFKKSVLYSIQLCFLYRNGRFYY